MPGCGIGDLGDHVRRCEHIDRRADPVQAAENVERMMLETREWPSRKEEINGDAFRHRISASHCRMLAKGLARP
jgi:hypothetical protein